MSWFKRKSPPFRIIGKRNAHSGSWFNAFADRANKGAKYLNNTKWNKSLNPSVWLWSGRFGSIATISTVAVSLVGTVATARWFRNEVKKENEEFWKEVKVHTQLRISERLLMEVEKLNTAADLMIQRTKWIDKFISPKMIPSSAVRIFVKLADDNIFVLTADVADTVKALKEQISEIAGIQVNYQMLFYDGAKLDDVRSVADYNLHEDCIIHLFDTSGGGGAAASNFKAY